MEYYYLAGKPIKTNAMPWDPKYSVYGIMQIDRKNVRVYSDRDDYITIGLGDEIATTHWIDGDLNITLKNGEVRLYKDRNNYITI